MSTVVTVSAPVIIYTPSSPPLLVTASSQVRLRVTGWVVKWSLHYRSKKKPQATSFTHVLPFGENWACLLRTCWTSQCDVVSSVRPSDRTTLRSEVKRTDFNNEWASSWIPQRNTMQRCSWGMSGQRSPNQERGKLIFGFLPIVSPSCDPAATDLIQMFSQHEAVSYAEVHFEVLCFRF